MLSASNVSKYSDEQGKRHTSMVSYRNKFNDFIFLICCSQVLPGLYVGNYRDSKDHQQLERHGISHIVAIHDSPRRLLPVSAFICFGKFLIVIDFYKNKILLGQTLPVHHGLGYAGSKFITIFFRM